MIFTIIEGEYHSIQMVYFIFYSIVYQFKIKNNYFLWDLFEFFEQQSTIIIIVNIIFVIINKIDLTY